MCLVNQFVPRLYRLNKLVPRSTCHLNKCVPSTIYHPNKLVPRWFCRLSTSHNVSPELNWDLASIVVWISCLMPAHIVAWISCLMPEVRYFVRCQLIQAAIQARQIGPCWRQPSEYLCFYRLPLKPRSEMPPGDDTFLSTSTSVWLHVCLHVCLHILSTHDSRNILMFRRLHTIRRCRW